jgi:hypothetical protein
MKGIVCLLTLALLVAGTEPGFAAPLTNAPASAKPATTPAADPERRNAAVAGEAFVGEVDAGRLHDTWTEAGPALRTRSTETAWVSTLETTRNVVGKVVDRKIKGVGVYDHLDGAPPGQYAAVFFTTSFANATVEEKAVFQKADGKWKVVGYFMKKTYTVKLW